MLAVNCAIISSFAEPVSSSRWSSAPPEMTESQSLSPMQKHTTNQPADLSMPEEIVKDIAAKGEGHFKNMPVIGNRALPHLDLSQLPFNPSEAAHWKVVYGKGVPTAMSHQLRHSENLNLLARRSPFKKTFAEAPSIYHLLHTVSRLRGHDAIEANYIAFLQVLFEKTNRGRQVGGFVDLQHFILCRQSACDAIDMNLEDC